MKLNRNVVFNEKIKEIPTWKRLYGLKAIILKISENNDCVLFVPNQDGHPFDDYVAWVDLEYLDQV